MRGKIYFTNYTLCTVIGRVDHRSRRKLGLVMLQGSLGGALGLRARTRGLQLTLLCRHREESRDESIAWRHLFTYHGNNDDKSETI